MIYGVYSVFDAAVKAYLPPFCVRAKGEALRSFSTAVNDTTHQFSKYANDYTLYELGTFDDSSGSFTVVPPVRVISAVECLVVEDQPLMHPPRLVPDARPM